MRLNDICKNVILKCFHPGDVLECVHVEGTHGYNGRFLEVGKYYIFESVSESCAGEIKIEGTHFSFNPSRFRKVS